VNDAPTQGERWLPVVGYEGLYEVTNRGRVRSLDRNVTTRAGVRRYKGRALRSTLVNGYPWVTLSLVGKLTARPVHQLVMEAFVGPRPEGQEVRHLNDIKTDCRWPENLAYGTKKENFADRLVNGKGNRGERHGLAVTNRDVVASVRARVAAGERQCDVAAQTGLTRANVWAIVHGKSWDWIPDGPRPQAS
jgi:hypothetical protein